MGQGVVGRKSSQGHGGGDGLVEAAGIAKGSNQPMVRLMALWIGGNRGAKGARCFCRLAFGEQGEATLEEGFGIGWVGCVHGSL